MHAKAQVSDPLARLGEALRGLPTPPGDAASAAERARALAEIAHLARRLAEGPDAPLRIALIGPTGCGKSKLLSSVAGVPASPSGYRRPFTERPLLYCHMDREEAARRTLPRSIPYDLYPHEDPTWMDGILIDAPDCDSVVEAHRRASAELERLADVAVLVCDVHKYGDASVWDALRRLAARGAPWAVVLNKVAGPGPVEDFRAKLAAEAIEVPLVEVPERAVPEADPLPGSEPAVVELRGLLAAEAAPHRRRAVLASGLRRVAAGLRASACDVLLPRLEEARAAIEAAREEAAAAFAQARSEIQGQLEIAIDPAARRDLYRSLLARIERTDPFRYPRRLLAMPWRAAAQVLRSAGIRPRRRPKGAAPELAELARRNREVLEEVVDRAAARVRDRLRELGRLVAFEKFEADAGVAGARAAARYRALWEDFQAWVREEAAGAAARLTVGHRVQFYLAQAIVGAILLGVQLQTGGALTLGEIVADGVITPILAKLTGIAVSSEEVRRFGARARDRHRELCGEIVDEEADRVAAHLARRLDALRPPEGLARAAEDVVALAAEAAP